MKYTDLLITNSKTFYIIDYHFKKQLTQKKHEIYPTLTVVPMGIENKFFLIGSDTSFIQVYPTIEKVTG